MCVCVCVGGGGGGGGDLAELEELLQQSNSEHSSLTQYTHKSITNLHTCMHVENLHAIRLNYTFA